MINKLINDMEARIMRKMDRMEAVLTDLIKTNEAKNSSVASDRDP